MGVGSLHTPREYDGRLPPDAGYYLDLVLPRKEEPPKKIGSQGEIVAWKNVTNTVINSHADLFQNIGKRASKTNQNIGNVSKSPKGGCPGTCSRMTARCAGLEAMGLV